MTNAKEMAQKGFDTGFTDTEGHELHVGDYVCICGHIGKIVFSCGAFGIFITDEIPWDTLEELVRKDSGNRPSFLYNDNFISFWEIVWNLSEDTDESCLPYVESITATGGIFTDENGKTATVVQVEGSNILLITERYANGIRVASCWNTQKRRYGLQEHDDYIFVRKDGSVTHKLSRDVFVFPKTKRA